MSWRCRNCGGKGTIRPLQTREPLDLKATDPHIRATWGARQKCPECGPPKQRPHGTRVPPETLADTENIGGYTQRVVQVVCSRMHDPGDTDQTRMQRREEAHLEALCIAYKVWEEWDPEKCASFRALLSTRLAQRLQDWWVRDQRQRCVAHRDSKTREWERRDSVSLELLAGQDQACDDTADVEEDAAAERAHLRALPALDMAADLDARREARLARDSTASEWLGPGWREALTGGSRRLARQYRADDDLFGDSDSRVGDAIDSLPAADRLVARGATVLWLRGYRDREVARKMGIKLGELRRVKQRIQESYGALSVA